MRKKNQVDDRGSVIKDRPMEGAAASTQNISQPAVLNSLPSPDVPSAGAPSSQIRDAAVKKKRQVLGSVQVNVPAPARVNAPDYNMKSVVKTSAEYQSKLQIVQQVCDAIDAEVKLRSEAIRALAAAQYSSFKAQLDLQMSKFSTDELDMPLEEYLKTCPGIEAVQSADGFIQLQKRSSPHLKLEESKRNLPDRLTKANDDASKGTNYLLLSPCSEPQLPATQSVIGSVASQHVRQEPEKKSVGEELNWPEYYVRLQSLGYTAGLTPSLESRNNLNTPMIFKGGLTPGVTPKTLRLPKPGETMLSINGSPLGQFGKTSTIKCSAGGTTRTTPRNSRLTSSKRSLRDF